MERKRFLAAWILLALMCALVMLWSENAHAAFGPSTSGLDKELSERSGVEGSLSSGKKLDDAKKAKPYQMAIGAGSILVMIAVVKWL
ncbi:MAG TPA: hypothetical protein PLO37_05700 [Candidatus Hydrogenedentes bacterium]|nr:hypothetical protein [Candidatus Hydrogenedentota bacterium]HPG66322.1 hypothetical protein [Candidatus Hydrogenedentota bacterium]